MMEGEYLLSVKGKAEPELDITDSQKAQCILVIVTVSLRIIAIGLISLSVVRYIRKSKKVTLRTFYVWLGMLAILGGTWAFFLPIAINSGFNKNDDGPVLRQLLIYTTGGLLGAVTLGETRRKNDQEHMRQVHAERRSRYAKAVEQLADEKAPIRLGGVYTLAKLVDDWLDDEKTLPSEKERRQEGQIIIDSLCAYIRSSFPLAERHDELILSYEEYQQNCQGNQDLHSPQVIPLPKPKNAKQSHEDFMRDKSLLREEQEVRKTVLSEIEKRLNSNKDKNEDGKGEVKPGTWSYFEYDFSSAVFFYPVDLSNSYFGASSKFSKTYFIQDANFHGAIFTQDADFESAIFDSDAIFAEATFQRADFLDAHFKQRAHFTKATFQRADFLGAHFEQHVTFRLADFHDAYFQSANFDQRAIFAEATFTQNADFSQATFGNEETYERAIFSKAKFKQSVLFSDTTFIEEPDFSRAKFSRIVDPKNYKFDVSRDSCKIDPKKEEYNGKEFIIPEGADLVDPNDPSEQEDPTNITTVEELYRAVQGNT